MNRPRGSDRSTGQYGAFLEDAVSALPQRGRTARGNPLLDQVEDHFGANDPEGESAGEAEANRSRRRPRPAGVSDKSNGAGDADLTVAEDLAGALVFLPMRKGRNDCLWLFTSWFDLDYLLGRGQG